MDSFLDSVISRSAARKKVADEEAIRGQVSETTARAVRKIRVIQTTREAPADFELNKIIADAEREVQTIRQECKNRSIDNGDEWITSELIRINMAIITENFIPRGGKSKDAKLDEPGLIAALVLDGQDGSLADRQELTKPSIEASMNCLSGSEEDLMRPSINRSGISPLGLSLPPDAVDESMQLDTKSESGDNKGWLRDNDDDQEIPLHRRPQYPFTRDTPRNSLYRWFPPAQPPSSLPARARERSRSPVNLEKAADSKENISSYRRRSLIRPPASQPVTGSGIFSAASQQSPSRRQQPRLKSVTMPLTSNIEPIFKAKVGSLYSPEHRLVELE
ncbi:hypothetical protein F4824DRAFT_452282 [Ustulina deusta]|nr:hypothetical protein F4824DRAFT_452282 [Ustulina deusta]